MNASEKDVMIIPAENGNINFATPPLSKYDMK